MKKILFICSSLLFLFFGSIATFAQNSKITITVRVDTNGVTVANLESKTTFTCTRDDGSNCGTGSTVSDFVAFIEPNERIEWVGLGSETGVNVKIRGVRLKVLATPNVLSASSYKDHLNSGKVKGKTKWNNKPSQEFEDDYDIRIHIPQKNNLDVWLDPKIRIRGS